MSTMPTFLTRVFLLYNLFNAILLYLVPKKLRHYLSSSWYSHPQPLDNPVSCVSPPHPKTRTAIMDPNELKRIYEMFDKNGDGRITKKELNDSLVNMGISISDEELTSMIEKIDSNHDGWMDFEEFGALYQAIMADQDEEEDMREAFSVFDQNGDGYISVEELKSVLASLGLKQGRTVEDCKDMIMKVDVNGDGRVDFTEFKRMMRGGGFAAALAN